MFSKISVLKAKRDISGYLPVLFIRFKGENKSVTIQIDVQIVLLIIPAKSFVVSYAKLPMSRPAPTTDIRHKPGPCEVGVSPPASFTPYAATGFPHFLTCIVVEHSGHVFLWEGIIGVAHEQAGFPHRTVPHHHTLQHLLLLAVTAAAAAVISFLAVHSCRSSCCDCADAVASPASPKAHEAVGSQWQA